VHSDDDFDLWLIGKNVIGFFVSKSEEDDVNLGLRKLITDSGLCVKNQNE